MLHPETQDISTKAEGTFLWVQDRSTGRHWNLLTVIEEVFPGQPWSPPLRTVGPDGREHPVLRHALDHDGFTLYASRDWFTDHSQCTHFLAHGSAGRSVTFDSDAILLEPIGEELLEPGSGGVTVPPAEERPWHRPPSPLQRTLPSRRVTADASVRMVPHADCEQWLGERRLTTAIEQIDQWLGIDLDGARELLGATIWSRPNPWMRALSFGLVHEGKALRIEAHERPGIECPSLQLTICSETALGRQPVTQLPWTGGALTCPLGHPPRELAVQIHDSNGRLLEDRDAIFLQSINFSTRISTGSRSVEVADTQGVRRTLTVSRSRDAGESRIGSHDTVSEWVREHERERERRALQRRGEFAYFGAFEGNAPERAEAFVRNLFRKVRYRCIVADPFLGAEEIHSFASFVGSLDARIDLLSGEEYLRESPAEGKTHGRLLADRLEQLQQADPAFRPQVRVLRGRHCPLHDRFLAVDDTVYHIGGSLNHLGRRAMAISRVPAPEPVMADLERWLDGERTEPLHDWLNRRGF